MIYLICDVTPGNEPGYVSTSAWSTKELADAEFARLGTFAKFRHRLLVIMEVPLDTPFID